MTGVPLLIGAVDVTGGSLPGLLIVQGVHGRAQGWAYLSHRLLVLGPANETLIQSAWALGPWGGDSVLRAMADIETDALPPSADP